MIGAQLAKLVMRLFKTGNKQGLSTLARQEGVKPRTLVKQAHQKLKVPGKKSEVRDDFWNIEKYPIDKATMKGGIKEGNLDDLLTGHSLPNPTKVKTMESISSMRKNPGIGAGLQRLESRKASALNTGGTPWSGKPLTYMGNISRAGTFNTLLQRDPGFRQFIKRAVGNARVENITPRIRESLARTYLAMKRRGLSRAENSYKAAMGKAKYRGPGYGRSGPDNVGQTGAEHPIYGVPGVDF
tara:strand:- start:29330 stop:30052 length:723 start_codon:yes stop_codon:yes gene_type:complete